MSRAVLEVNIEMVRLLFDLAENNDKIGPIDLELSDYWGNTPLHLIAKAPYKPYAYVSA